MKFAEKYGIKHTELGKINKRSSLNSDERQPLYS